MTTKDPHAAAVQHYDAEYFGERLKADADLRALRRTSVYTHHISGDDTILDFGCADGSVLHGLPGKRKAGVEVNPVAREEGIKRGIDARASLEDFKGEKFTRIISSHVLEHVVDPANVLAQLRDYLTPDGKLVLILPMDDYRNPWHRRWFASDPNKHLYAWTPLTLGNLLTVSGYHPQSVEVLRQTFPRGAERIAKVSPSLYLWVGRLYAIVRPIHQLVAVASPNVAYER